MRKLLLLLSLMVCGLSQAAEPVPPSTAFTRTLLRAPNSATARDVLGISNFVYVITGGTNNGTNVVFNFTNSSYWFINPANSNTVVVSRFGSAMLVQASKGGTNAPYFVFAILPSGLIVYTNADFRAGLEVSGGTFAGNLGGGSNAVDLVAGGTNVTVTPSAGNRVWTISVSSGTSGSTSNIINNGTSVIVTDTTGAERFGALATSTRVLNDFGEVMLFGQHGGTPYTGLSSPDGSSQFQLLNNATSQLTGALMLPSITVLPAGQLPSSLLSNLDLVVWDRVTSELVRQDVRTRGFAFADTFGLNTATNSLGKTVEDIGRLALKAPFSTNYTIVGTDSVLACTGTNQLITLQNGTNGVAAGRIVTLLMSSTTGYGSAIATNANGFQTVLTAAGLSQTITNGQSLTLIWDGANWR